MNKILIIILLWVGVTTAVSAHPEYVAPTEAAGCTSCHNDKFGNGFKPGVLQAAYCSKGLIECLKDYIDEQEEDEDSRPILSPINTQWDVTVGEIALKIPLRVYDDEEDNFVIHGSSPSGYTFSKVYMDSASELPAVSYQWKPATSQANKIYTVSFYAQETGSNRSLKSNTVTTYVHVWPARNSATKNVSLFMLQSAQWASNKLTFSGLVTFKPTVTAAQRTAALKSLWMSVKSYSGKVISSPLKLTPGSNGVWTKTLALTGSQVPCSIRLNYEGLNVARTVKLAPATCVK